MIRTCAASLLALAASLPLQAMAADSDDQEIIVTGARDGYATTATTSGTKTSTPLIDVPQAISVVTQEQIQDEAMLTIADVVRHVPGVSAGQGEGHRDQITLRGNNSTADFFVDGLRDDVQYVRSLYNVERVEVHKGPNAMIFGRGGGGGVINRISKGARTDRNLVGATGSINSYGAWYVSGDANLVLSDTVGARINGFYEELNNHRDFYDGHHYGINPVVGAQLGEVRLQLGYEHLRDDRVIDRGIPSAFTGSLATPAGPAKGFYKSFFGVPGLNRTEFDADVLRFRGEADLSSSLKANLSLLYGSYDKTYANAFAATAIGGTAAAPTIGIEAYRDPTTRENFIAQANLEWKVATGSIDHLILFGGEFTDQDTTNARINGFFNPTILTAAGRRAIVPLTNPLAVPPIFLVAGPTGNNNRQVASSLKQASAYLQDQISFGDRLDLIIGIRYDRFDLAVTDVFNASTVSRIDDLWSPRAGLVFKPVPNASLYISYTKSYLPQSGDQFLTLTASLATLKPETFDNYELGAKWDIRPGLSATAAVYQLDRGNTRAVGSIPGTVVLTGEQRSKGFEFGLNGRITPKWQAAIGYAYTTAKITSTTAAAPAGRAVAQVPHHQLSLWNRYDFTKRFGLGLGLYHQSASFAQISNATRLPGYVRVDAAAFFKLNDKIDLQLNVENLTDKRYFPVAHTDNNISTGAPLNARLTASVKF
jgi:catecholate siderophore receptor